MPPRLQFLNDALIDRIVDEAKIVLAEIGVAVEHADAVRLLKDHGATDDASGGRVRIPAELVDGAVASAPSSFRLFGVLGEPTHDFSGIEVHFTPASSAILVADITTGEARPPVTADYLTYAKVVSGLPGIHAQSTAIGWVERVLCIDERGRPALPLHLGNHMKGQRGLTRRLHAEHFDDSPFGYAAHSKSDIQCQRSRGNSFHLKDLGPISEPHDRSFAIRLLDLFESAL